MSHQATGREKRVAGKGKTLFSLVKYSNESRLSDFFYVVTVVKLQRLAMLLS